MKKRSLLTSLALMLVAILCFASASYAWFQSGLSATAGNIELTIQTASSSLLFSHTGTDGTWSQTLDYTGTEGILIPVSTYEDWETPPSFFTSVYNSELDLDEWGDFVAATPFDGTGTDQYTAYDIYVKNAAEDNLNLKFVSATAITSADTDAVAALRVGIYDYTKDEFKIYTQGSTSTYTGVIKASAGHALGQSITWNGSAFVPTTDDTNEAYDPADYDTTLFDTAVEPDSIAACISNGTTVMTASNTVQQYTIYVWVEGNDPKCHSNMISGVDDVKIQLDFEATVAA